MDKKFVSQFKDEIIKKINSQEIQMKPKFHFILTTILYIGGLIFGALCLVYLISFLIYFFNIQSLEQTRNFGLYGLKIFLYSLPWFIMLLAGILFVILQILVRHFSFGYKKSILYTVGAIVILITSTSIAIAKTSFHDNLQNTALKRQVPIMQQFYKRYEQVENMHRGIARDIQREQFILDEITFEHKSNIIKILERTRVKPGLKIQEGDIVIVIGEAKNSEILAEGIHIFGETDRFRLRHMNDMMNKNNIRKIR